MQKAGRYSTDIPQVVEGKKHEPRESVLHSQSSSSNKHPQFVDEAATIPYFNEEPTYRIFRETAAG